MAYEECPGYMKNGRCKGNNRPCRVTKEDIESWFDETLKPIDLLDVCPEQSAFGNNFFRFNGQRHRGTKNGKGLICKGRVWCFSEI